MALNDHVHVLSQIDIFRPLNAEALRLIAFSSETRFLRAGDVLFKAGEASDAGFVVLSGALTLAPEGSGAAQTARPGMLVGEMALITPTRRPATAAAVEITGVLRITRALFMRVLNEFPECAVQLHHEISTRAQRHASELRDFRARYLAV